MPEGPELKVVSDKLGPLITGLKILEVACTPRAKQENLNFVILNEEIIKVNSYGKKLLFYLNSGVIVSSFGMEGKWLFKQGNHSHIRITLGDPDLKYQMFFDDTRYFGSVIYVKNENFEKYLSQFGPDILVTEISPNHWKEILRKTKRKIAEVLKDQHLISSIGNYLCCDALYYAKIKPDRPANSLSDVEVENLRISSHWVVRESYKYGGLTIKSFFNVDGTPGLYPTAVYGKSKDSHGNTIIKMKISSQNIYWVPQLQI